MAENIKRTPFLTVYDYFFTRVTDDMYMEMTELDTYRDLQNILITSISRFGFPRFDIFDYEEGYLDEGQDYCGVESDGQKVPATIWVGGFFNSELTIEEFNILSMNMLIEWFYRQLATTELSREKYSGSDFKFTSQANHMAKLKNMIEKAEVDSHHLQNLYKRRNRTAEGQIVVTMDQIMGESVRTFPIGLNGYKRYDY